MFYGAYEMGVYIYIYIYFFLIGNKNNINQDEKMKKANTMCS